MTTPFDGAFLSQAKTRLAALLDEGGLLDEDVLVRVGLLTPEQAIGTPLRRDFPILAGKEKVIEARFRSAHGRHLFPGIPNVRGFGRITVRKTQTPRAA